MGNLEIRRLLPDSWQTYRQLRLSALADAPQAFGSSLEEVKRLSDDDWRQRLEQRVQFAAYLDGKVVGTVGGRAADDSHTAELISMWVDPAARRRSVGEKLVETVLDWARAAGFPEIRLWVSQGNEAAERLYNRKGFRRTGASQPMPNQPGRLEYEMSMPLQDGEHSRPG